MWRNIRKAPRNIEPDSDEPGRYGNTLMAMISVAPSRKQPIAVTLPTGLHP